MLPTRKICSCPSRACYPQSQSPWAHNFHVTLFRLNIKHMLRQDWILQHLTTFTKECCKHLGFLYDHNYPLSFWHHFRSSRDDVNLPQQWAQPGRFETTTRQGPPVTMLRTQLRTSDATRLPVSSWTSKHSRTLASQKRPLFFIPFLKKTKRQGKEKTNTHSLQSRFSSVTPPFLSLDALCLHCGQSPTELLG